LNNYTPLYLGSLRRIMSATLGGFVHAKAIENLKVLISDFLVRNGHQVTWSQETPCKEGGSYIWKHTFQSGSSSRHLVKFTEDGSGKLFISVDNSIVVEVEKDSRLRASDYHNILESLGR